MSKKFNLGKVHFPDAHKKKKDDLSSPIKIKEEKKQLEFKKRYYNIQIHHIFLQSELDEVETNQPLPLSELEERIRYSIRKMDKLSVSIIMDLFFIYLNWNTFYKRGEAFTGYLKKSFPFSRAYAYDIIRTVKMLIKYYEEKVSTEWTLLDVEFHSVTNGCRNFKEI